MNSLVVLFINNDCGITYTLQRLVVGETGCRYRMRLTDIPQCLIYTQ